VGMGVNVNHRAFPPDLQQTATSLRLATGTEWSRVELTAALLKSLEREYRGLLAGAAGRESILRRFAERSSYVRGKNVRIADNGGFEGLTAGLDAHGFLQVQTPQGLRTVLSGTVWPRR
jgi:BirA family transcriptional regulator, biotin operon repressor / biotin---[acetyl-CoA-carboxylase] ligase